jgi:hypothetical protein
MLENRREVIDVLAAQFGEELVADARKALLSRDLYAIDVALKKIGHTP